MSWAVFEYSFKARFVNTTERREKAKSKLRQLLYVKGQRYIDHLETCLKLCHDIDDGMQESEVVRRVTRTLGPDHTLMLAGTRPRTVEELRQTLKYLDSTLPFLNSQEAQDSAINAVRDQRVDYREYPSPNRDRSPARSPSPSRSSRPTNPYLRRERRSAENLPICYWCNEAGHVVRYCRNRQRGLPAKRFQASYSASTPRANSNFQPGNF